MSPIIGIIDSAKSGNLFSPTSAYDSIGSITVGGTSVASITFTGIPSTYSHLEIRFIARVATAAYFDNIFMRFNGDSGANYTAHYIESSGTAILANSGGISNTLMLTAKATGTTATNRVSGGIINILDYSNTNKNKTSRTTSGAATNTTSDNSLFVTSQLWMSKAPVSSITLYSNSNFTQYSSFALYGVK
jgi:hypothetical protein